MHHDTFVQTRETMLNVTDIPASLALKTDSIVSLEAFLTRADEEDRFRDALSRAFEGALPPVTAVPANALPHPHQAVMIKAVAAVDAG